MPASAADCAPVRFSTDDLPEQERLPRWREEFGRSLVRVDIEPLSPELPFHAEATLQALPGVRTASITGSAAHFHRTQAMAAEGDDSIWLVINLGPKAIVSQRGKDVVLGAGDAVPIFTDEAATLISTQHLGFLFPQAALASRVSDVDDAATRVISHAVEPLRLLVTYFALLQKEVALGTPELRQSVKDHVHDLAAMALGANRDIREPGLSAAAAARLAAALAHIAESFTEPGFTLAAAARRQGVSPRYLQRLLEASGTSFTARVNELRLQRAFALLTKGCGSRQRISDIALEAGFSDISNFNRLFRSRFGDTPSGIRCASRQPSRADQR
jgi:AraC-like DNA-binding protein